MESRTSVLLVEEVFGQAVEPADYVSSVLVFARPCPFLYLGAFALLECVSCPVKYRAPLLRESSRTSKGEKCERPTGGPRLEPRIDRQLRAADLARSFEPSGATVLVVRNRD